MRGRRTKLAPGIWRDASGISIVVHTKLEYLEERHPLETPLGKLNRRRETLRAEARGRAASAGVTTQPARRRATTLVDDVPVYLKAVAAMPTIRRARTAALPLRRGFRQPTRQSIAPHEIQARRDAWMNEGKSASWINHHLRALSNLFRTLSPDAPNPVRLVREVEEPEAIPRAIPPAVVAAILRRCFPRRRARDWRSSRLRVSSRQCLRS
jgi:hypothetical protein